MPPQLVPTYAHVERFPAGSPESVSYLEAHGYVVIASVLSTSQAQTALTLTWDYLEALGTGIDRNDPGTWSDDRWPVAVHGGIIPSQGIGHSAAQWFIRSVPAVKAAFAAVWDDEDLLTSFDGMALWRPTSVNPEWETNRGGSWMHIDQHPIGRPGFHCVQGLVSLLPTTETTGGNMLVPGSHRLFESIPERYGERLARIDSSIDHFRFPSDDPQLLDPEPIVCHLEAGDMLLWDSRTIHCSTPGTNADSGDDAHVGLERVVSLICMMPRAKSNEAVIEKRRAAVLNRTSTTNWSDRFINADRFPNVVAVTEQNPNKYQLPPVPELDETQKAMVG